MQVQATADHAAHVEKISTHLQRQAALQNQEFILQQIAEKLEQDFTGDTSMTAAEREFMAPELTQAENTVKLARHINIY